MLHLADVHVVFDDFTAEYITGKWYADFSLESGLGSKASLANHIAKKHVKNGKKIHCIAVYKSNQTKAPF